jgi:hypothetical protein
VCPASSPFSFLSQVLNNEVIQVRDQQYFCKQLLLLPHLAGLDDTLLQ